MEKYQSLVRASLVLICWFMQNICTIHLCSCSLSLLFNQLKINVRFSLMLVNHLQSLWKKPAIGCHTTQAFQLKNELDTCVCSEQLSLTPCYDSIFSNFSPFASCNMKYIFMKYESIKFAHLF